MHANNGNEGVTPHSSKLQNQSLTLGCSLVSYMWSFFRRVLPLGKGCSQYILGTLNIVVFRLMWHTRVDWKVHRPKSSYDDVMTTVDVFLPIGSKHCNTDGSTVQTVRSSMLKNKPYFVTFHESILVGLWTVQSILVSTYEGELKSSYDDVIYTVDFFTNGIRPLNIDTRNAWITRESMLKKKLFHESILVSQWTFQ